MTLGEGAGRPGYLSPSRPRPGTARTSDTDSIGASAFGAMKMPVNVPSGFDMNVIRLPFEADCPGPAYLA